MKLSLTLLILFSSSIVHAQEVGVVSADKFPSTFKGHIEELDNGQLLYRDGRLLKDFDQMGKINPKYFMQNRKVVVEICDHHFPQGSIARNEIDSALNEYSQLQGVNFNWLIQDVPHRNADVIISPNMPSGLLRIDFADVDNYPNKCKKKGKKGKWILTRCGFSNWGGWDTSDILGNLDAGAILINRYKYCSKDESKCLTNFPLKQVYLHEIGHFFGMTHSNSWPKQHKAFTSVMGAHQDNLTVYDAKNLRSNYGITETQNNSKSDQDDFVVMGRMKWENEGLNFSEANPSDLYVVSSDLPLYDCKTKAPAKFQVGLYNRSASDIGEQFEVDVAIGVAIGERKLDMVNMVLTDIPRYSEIVWKGEFKLPSQLMNINEKIDAQYFLHLTPSRKAESIIPIIRLSRIKSKHLQLMDVKIHPSIESCRGVVKATQVSEVETQESGETVEGCFEE